MLLNIGAKIMSKIEQLKKCKNLTLMEVYNLLCNYNYKYEQTQKRISKKDFKEYTFLTWLYNKLIHNEANILQNIDNNKIGILPKIPNLKTYCNNDKNKIAHREKNQTTYGVKRIFQNLYITTYEKPLKQNKTKNKKQVIIKKNFNDDIIKKQNNIQPFDDVIKRENETAHKLFNKLVKRGYSYGQAIEKINNNSSTQYNILEFI